MKNILIKMLIIPFLLLSGCDSPLSALFSPPHCTVVNVQEVDGSQYSLAKFIVTVKNDGGGATAYNVGCTVKLKDGSYIVETEVGYFGTLEDGESTSAEIVFGYIKTKADYQTSDINLYWWNSQDTYYHN
jgi:hypothetical protein